MKRSILLTMLLTLFAALTISAAEPWQLSFSRKTSPCFKSKGVYSQFTSPLIELDENEIDKARQRADFEMKKRAALDAQRRYAEAQAEIEKNKAAIEAQGYKVVSFE